MLLFTYLIFFPPSLVRGFLQFTPLVIHAATSVMLLPPLLLPPPDKFFSYSFPFRQGRDPTDNGPLINFLLSRNFVNEHRLSIQIAQKCKKKCLCVVYVFQLNFHFAYQRWWLGGGRKMHVCNYWQRRKEEEGKGFEPLLSFFFLVPWKERRPQRERKPI